MIYARIRTVDYMLKACYGRVVVHLLLGGLINYHVFGNIILL